MLNQRTRSLFLSLTLALLIAGGGTYYAFHPSRQDGSTTALTAADPPSVTLIESYTGQPDNFTSIAKNADYVIQGVIEEVSSATWTTPDGKAPEQTNEQNPLVQIRTPVRLSVERIFKGRELPRTVVFSFIGGKVGNSVMMSEDTEIYKPGNRLIVFLYKGQADSAPGRVHPDALFPSMPFVIDGNIAHGPAKDVPLTDLIAQIEQAN
jgi:hypothetical protein